jgi:DNA-binding CsgD family transcriptional regulator
LGALDLEQAAFAAKAVSGRRRSLVLSPRQREVLALLAFNMTDGEIADRLRISPRTARAHCDALKAKLGVDRRRHIVGAFRLCTGLDPAGPALDPASATFLVHR